MDNTVLHCAWLINPGETPRQNVRLTICNGVVAEIIECPVDERSKIRQVALLPQFVNAHTHLEFSKIESPLPPPERFTEWIRAVIKYRGDHANGPEIPARAIEQGCRESIASGTRFIGEITTSEAATQTLLATVGEESGRAISFRELIGFTADRRAELIALAEHHLSSLSAQHPGHVTAGISPHAPYSVHPDVVEAAAVMAASANVPIAMHLAETLDELEFLANRNGAFVDFLKPLGLWDANVLATVTQPLDYLHRLAKAPHVLAVHCNYLSHDEIKFLGTHPNVTVVYCPRTHAYFRHSPHPWQELKAAGASVALGTDSRASNPDLNVWKELQHVGRQQHAPPAWKLLSMITTDAATAIGRQANEFIIREQQPLNAVMMSCECDHESRLNNTLLARNTQPSLVDATRF